jgi:hypothetical protein
MARPKLSIGVINADTQQTALLASMLRVIGNMAVAEWEVTDAASAHVLVVPEERTADLADFGFREGGLPLVVSTKADVKGTPRPPIVVEAPLRVIPFLHALNEASARLQSIAGSADVNNLTRRMTVLRQHAQSDPEAAEREGALVDLLVEVVDQQRAWQIQTSHGAITIFPAGRKVATEGFETGSPFDLLTFDTPARMTQLRSVTPEHRPIRQGSLIELDELLWKIGVGSGKRGLLAPLLASAPLRLRRVPDFGRLGYHVAHMRAATLLANQRVAPAELYRKVGIPSGYATAFLNACYLCNLLVTEDVQRATSTIPMPSVAAAAAGAPASLTVRAATPGIGTSLQANGAVGADNAAPRGGFFAAIRKRLGLGLA